MPSFSSPTKVFFASLLAVPVTYGFNALMEIWRWEAAHPLWFHLGVAIVIFVVMLVLIKAAQEGPASPRKQDRMLFYIFSMFSFTGVVSLIIGLELDGLISGFVCVFLKIGEPYLRSGHGAMINYWNGTVMYSMYLMMLAAICWSTTFYEVALFWCGSIMNSMIVLLLSVFTGKHGITMGSVLYIPFVIIPPFVMLKLAPQRQSLVAENKPKHLWHRKEDVLLIIYLLVANAVCVFRGLAVLDSKIEWIQNYVKDIEPYLELKDPAPFPKIQMLLCLFHFLPVHILSIYGLTNPGCSWMPDLTLFHAGASLQAQVTHIGASLHPRTPYILRVPPDLFAQLVFWIVNLALAVGPQLLAYRCSNNQDYFVPQHIPGKEEHNNKVE